MILSFPETIHMKKKLNVSIFNEIQNINNDSIFAINEYTQKSDLTSKARTIFIETGEISEVVRPEIAKSWRRCQKLGMNTFYAPAKKINEIAFSNIALKHRFLMEAASQIIDSIYNSLKNQKLLIYLTDRDENILYMKGSNSLNINLEDIGLAKGFHWSEKNIGTNAISLALMYERDFQTIGSEHYMEIHHDFNCATALIKMHNEIVGTLTMTFSKNYFSTHFLSLVKAGAVLIENHLLKMHSSEIMDLTFNKSTEGMAFLDLDLNVTKVNKSFLEILHTDEQTAFALDFTKLFYEVDFQKIIENKRKHTNIKETFIRYKKKLRRITVDISVIKQDFQFCLVIMCREIDEIINLSQNYNSSNSYFTFDNIITQNPKMLNLIETAKKVSSVSCSILIEGESGTGKELFSQSIHSMSDRKKNPFIVVNCAAIPVELVESELFGYERGTFTGALSSGKPGKFELANNGTIFLDEIGELPLDVQAKLLRALDNHKITRMGGKQEKSLNIRVLAATNRSLYKEVQNKNFREDLYYRLNVLYFKLPSLKERPEDIPLLAYHFLEKLNSENNDKKYFNTEFLNALMSHSWNGNIRELQNTVTRAYYICSSDEISKNMLTPHILNSDSDSKECSTPEPTPVQADPTHTDSLATIQDSERTLIINAIKKTNGKAAQAALLINMSKATIYRKIKKYDIKPVEFKKELICELE